MLKQMFWLYLEPYTFVFKGSEEAVVYNTINSAYIRCRYSSNCHQFFRAITELDNPDNGYCVEVDEEDLSSEEFTSWVKQICTTFSGNLIPASGKKPFIMKPVCRVYNSIERIKKDKEFSFGRKVLENLNEVSLYLSHGQSFLLEESKYPHYRQFIYNSSFPECKMGKEDYKLLFAKLAVIRIGKLNILNFFHCPFRKDLLKALSECDFKKCFYLDFEDLCEYIEQIPIDDNVKFVTHFSSCDNISSAMQRIPQLKDIPIDWRFIVSCENDLMLVEELQDQLKIDFTIVPYFNGNNISFFEKYVFNELSDILSNPLDKRCIFRRKLLNENFFGKLTILPSGEVYANVNCSPIGNVLNEELSKMVYKEMTDSTAWFMTRDRGDCKDCVHRYLCPSISNYELVSGKMNMCHVRK